MFVKEREREKVICKQATEAFGLCERYSLTIAPTSPVHKLQPSHHKILSGGRKEQEKQEDSGPSFPIPSTDCFFFPMALNRDETGLLR